MPAEHLLLGGSAKPSSNGSGGTSAHTVNEWLKKAEIHSVKRAGLPNDMAEMTRALARQNRELRPVLGVEPICRLLPIAPSSYYEVVAKRTDVDRLSPTPYDRFGP